MTLKKYGMLCLSVCAFARIRINTAGGPVPSAQRITFKGAPGRTTPHLLVVTMSNTYETKRYQNVWNSSAFIDRNFSTLAFDVSQNNEYPPFRQNFNLWQSLQELPERYTWYTRCDYDTFLNGRMLRTVLDAFDASLPQYLGRIGHGRPKDARKAHITFPFVMGGGCETVNREALLSVDIDACRADSVNLMRNQRDNLHSDVEFGRCLGVSGTVPTNIERIRIVYTNRLEDSVVQLSRLRPEDVLAFHPIKSPQIRAAFERNPKLLTPQRRSDCALSPVHTYMATSCGPGKSLNPGDKCGEIKPRCSVPNVSAAPFLIASVHVMGFTASSRRVPDCIQHANAATHYHVPVNVAGWTYLTKGETSYLQTYALVLRNAISRGIYPFVVLEDDFMVHKDICQKWRSIDAHCAYTAAQDGILLLGHTMYAKAPWAFFEESNTCHDLQKFGYGSFANVYSKRGASAMLQWLVSMNDMIPADHFYYNIIDSGISVRALSPPLVVADVSHTSTVDPSRKSNNMTADERHRIHRWGDRNAFAFELGTS